MFFDATKYAYGLCAYIHSIFDMVKFSYDSSHMKKAPIKKQTISRLELMGTVMSNQLTILAWIQQLSFTGCEKKSQH